MPDTGGLEPFSSPGLREDQATLTSAERTEALFQIRQVRVTAGIALNHLSMNSTTRGQVARDIDAAQGYLERLRQVLTAASGRERAQREADAEGISLSNLRRHLTAVHCNLAGMGLDLAEAMDDHAREHHGPGGLRNHDEHDLSWDQASLDEVIEEGQG